MYKTEGRFSYGETYDSWLKLKHSIEFLHQQGHITDELAQSLMEELINFCPIKFEFEEAEDGN